MSSPPQRNSKGHVRNVSDSRRVAMPRRNTRGPLEMSDDEAPQPPTPTERTRTPLTPALQTNLPPSPGVGTGRGSQMTQSTLLSPDSITSYDTPLTPNLRPRAVSPNVSRPRLDLSPLLRFQLYSQIPTSGIPPPFLRSAHQPAPDTPLQYLLENGHFRLAAERAAAILCSSEVSPFDLPRVLELFHTRLACLVLISHPEIAAKEARALLDILAREGGAFSNPGSRAASLERAGPGAGAPGERVNPLSLIPWDLRLLLERLKTVLTNDARRGIMNLYSLASECRAHAARAARNGDEEGRKLWGQRLQELGIRVASALVEMGESETAIRQLHSLNHTASAAKEDDKAASTERIQMATRLALLYLRVGDLDAAERCYRPLYSAAGSDSSTPYEADVLRALHLMCAGDYSSAADQFAALHAQHPTDELARHNLAICLLYAGDVQRASELLEALVNGTSSDDNSDNTTTQQQAAAFSFPGLLFNLATIYELRTERARDKKVRLVERIADRGPVHVAAGDGGAVVAAALAYEHHGAEFKL